MEMGGLMLRSHHVVFDFLTCTLCYMQNGDSSTQEHMDSLAIIWWCIRGSREVYKSWI